MHGTWFSVFIILLIQIYGNKADCIWAGGGVEKQCNIYCINLKAEEIGSALERKLNQDGKEVCRDTGIYLELRSNTYPENVMKSKCITLDVKVIKLDVAMMDLVDVENDAFLCDAFQTVKELKMTNMGIKMYGTNNFNVIRNGTFNGLNELEVLNIESAGGIGIIENGVLDSLNELRQFKFIQSLNSNSQINVKGFTGSGKLAKLEFVQFKYKLTNSITDTTFVGLTNVKTLDLSSCQIEVIGSNSFQPIGNSIQEINLRSNHLTTIKSGLFDILPKTGLTIDITGNKFHCDCELIYLRSILEQFESHFNGSIACSTLDMSIEGCITKNVLESECFNDCERPPTTQPTTYSTITHTPPPITTVEPEKYFTKECYKPDEFQPSDVEVSIKQPSTYMTITETESGEVNLNIDSQYSSSVVIWFRENQESVEDINCISLEDRTSIPITDLEDNVIYSFCLMDKTKSIVSPLDCISHIKRGSVWLLESSKALTVTLIVISLMLNVVFGIGIGFWIFNYNPFAKSAHSKTSHMPMQSKTPVANNDIIDRDSYAYGRKVSNITNNSGTTTRTTLSYGKSTYNAPPLPERPSNMRIFDEPTYATVDDIYKDDITFRISL